MKTTILSVVLLIGIAVSGIGQTKSTLDNLSWLSGFGKGAMETVCWKNIGQNLKDKRCSGLAGR